VKNKMANILLVEDNQDDVELAMHAIRKNELKSELVVVEDGQAALDFLFATGEHSNRPHDDLPELVLLDLNLPRVGGLDVLRQMRASETTRHIPVVILTTSDDEYDIKTGYALGANSFVRKPMDFQSFVGVMKQINEYWLGINTPPIGAEAVV